jgi:hypothetical protein
MNNLLRDKKIRIMIAIFLVIMIWYVTVQISHAADVSSVIQSAWTAAKEQIKNVVNNVVFPIIDLVLAVFFFVKLGTAYFDYRKQGQFEWTAPAILFACLCFTLTAPTYIWTII